MYLNYNKNIKQNVSALCHQRLSHKFKFICIRLHVKIYRINFELNEFYFILIHLFIFATLKNS